MKKIHGKLPDELQKWYDKADALTEYELSKDEVDYLLSTYKDCIKVNQEAPSIKDLIESEFNNELSWYTYVKKEVADNFIGKKYKLEVSIKVKLEDK